MRSSTPRTVLPFAAAALALTGGATLAHAAATSTSTPTPKVVQAELVTAPELQKGVSGVVFRTDHLIPRVPNHGTLKARVAIKGGSNASIGTARGPKHHACYVGYAGQDLKVGRRYAVTITIGHVDYHRTLTLREHPKRVADFGGDLDC